MSSSAPDLENAIGVLAALWVPADGEVSDADALERLELVEAIGRRADVLRVRAAGDIAARSRRELGSESLARRHGVQAAGVLIEKHARVSATEAARRMRLAADTAPRVSLVGEVLPARFSHVAEAFDAGDVGVDAALTIVRCLGAAERRASLDDLQAGERALVAYAQGKSADLVGVQARVWRDALDPDGAEPRDAELRGRRSLVIGREVDGMTPFSGWADPTSASQLRTWFGSRTAPDALPRFLDPDDCENDAGPRDDPRTREQRTFDVFMGLLLAGVRAEGSTTGARHGAASVMVIMNQTALVTGRGTARLSDVSEPISAASAATIACDSGIQPVYLAPNGQPLALGRRERYHTAAQRKAMVVRDGPGCAWNRCTAPPSWTHAHHVIPWSQDGPTDLDNGVLLCPFHHRLVHEGEFEIKMVDSMPYLRAPLHLAHGGEWRPMGHQGHERAALAA